MPHILRSVAPILFALPLQAQTADYPHLVLTRLPGSNPSAAIVAADLSLGTVSQLGRFAADTLPPLAIALDPFDRHVLVAVELQPGTSRIVRLEPSNSGFVQHPMCDVAGRVTSLWVLDDDLFVASDGGGGVLRAPRRGGPATLAIPTANLTAMNGYGPNGPSLVLGWTGRAGTANPYSGVALVDAWTGQPYLGPHTFGAPANVELTGAVDLPTGVPRQLLSFADGSFWLFAGLIGPPIPVTPSVPIPPGGAVAMAPIANFGAGPLVLGGAVFPYLYSIDFWSGQVALRSPALPGDPVDFCHGGDRNAHGYRFANGCGAISFSQTWTGYPSPGTTFSMQVLAPFSPSPFLLLCLGLTDFPGLPASLPGGCRIDVGPDAVALHPLVSGTATQPLTIPGGPGFLGTLLFAQWFDLGAAGIATSDAVSYQIGY